MATALYEIPETEAGSEMPGDVHARRRERFLAEIGDGVAVLCSAPELIKSRDTEVLYRQDSDFFYLTGFREPGVAVLTPHDPEHRFTLFVRPRDPEKETWNGPRAGVDGAKERFGAVAAYPLDELDERLKTLLEAADAIWYALGSNDEMDRRLTRWIREWRLRRGRTAEARKALGEKLLAAADRRLAEAYAAHGIGLTVEIHEIDPDMTFRRNTLRERAQSAA